jgi:hypothetical protein
MRKVYKKIYVGNRINHNYLSSFHLDGKKKWCSWKFEGLEGFFDFLYFVSFEIFKILNWIDYIIERIRDVIIK